jgi:predicted metalloendopeptidase
MIRNIRSAFIDLLEESTWMDDASKSRAIDKVSVIEKKKLSSIFNIGISD